MSNWWWGVSGLVVVGIVTWGTVTAFKPTQNAQMTETAQAPSQTVPTAEAEDETTWYGEEEAELIEVIDLSRVYDPVLRIEPVDDFPKVPTRESGTHSEAVMPYIGDTEEPPHSDHETCWIGQVIRGFGWMHGYCVGECPARFPIGKGACGTRPTSPATMDTLEIREGDVQPGRPGAY